MNELRNRLKTAAERLASLLREHRMQVVEWGKTVLILVLCLNALWLAGRTGLFGGVDLLDGLRERLLFSTGAGSGDPAGEYQTAAVPQVVAVSPERGTRYAAAYSTETETLYERFATFLGEALGSAGMPEAVSRAQWEAAIGGRGVFFDYVQDQSLLCVAAWQGTTVPDAAMNHTARRFFLAVEDSSVALYYVSAATGQTYRCTTAVVPGTLETRMDAYASNGASFAFEDPAYAALDPYALIIPGAQEVHAVSMTNQGLPDHVEEIMQLLGMNYITATNYSESDGGRVYLDGDNTLRLGADGVIWYEHGETQESLPGAWSGREDLPDVVEAMYQTTLKLIGDTGDSQLRLVGADYDVQTQQYRVRFDATIGGMRIIQPGGSAADYVVQRGRIVQATVRLRRYDLTGESQTPLPGVQAAALVAAGGGTEPIRVYRDTGEGVSVTWLNRRMD